MPLTTIHSLRYYYETFGPENGFPVVLLHAFPLRGALWNDQANLLAREAGARVIVPDLRGFGTTDAPAGPYTMEDQAGDVLLLLDELRIDRFVLGGLSMGGYVSFAVARQAQQRLHGLILADTKATADSEAARLGREEMARLAEQDGVAAVARAMLPRLLTPATLDQNGDLTATVRSWIEGNTPAGIAGAARGMALRPDAADVLATVTCPTLVLVGSEDTTTPVTESQAMFGQLADAKLEIIEQAAHLSNLEQPAQFNAALLHFVRGVIA